MAAGIVAACCSNRLLLEGTQLGTPRQPRLGLPVLHLLLQLSSPSQAAFLSLKASMWDIL